MSGSNSRIFLPLLLTVLLPAQNQPPVISVTTRLVEVNVIVRDHKGPVEGLTKDDFTLFDKGRPQNIAFFSVASSHTPQKPPPPLPENVFTNIPERRGETPTSASVVLLDFLNTPSLDQPYARAQFVKFLKQLKPEDRVAVYVLGRKLTVLNDFTHDARRLLEAVDKYSENTGLAETADPSGNNGGDTSGNIQAILTDARTSASDFANMISGEITIAGLNAIANHLGHLPGRKNLVWITSRIPLRIDAALHLGRTGSADRNLLGEETFRAVKALNDANIAVYPVDARGLMPGPTTMSAMNGPVTRAQAARGLNVSSMPVTVNHDAMIGVAKNTGGIPFYNTNDLKGAIRKAVDDSEVTYTLAFHPDSADLDSTFHEIKVQVKNKNYDVRYRAGYLAMPDTTTSDKQRAEDIRNALWSPLESSSIGLAVRVDPVNEPRPGTLHVTLSISPGDIAMLPKDGKWTGALDYVISQRSADGRFLNRAPQGVALNLEPDRYKAMLTEGITINKTVEPVAGAVELRIVLLDRTSGKVGSVIVPLKR